LDKKFEKKLLEEENNEVGEELNIDETESNLVNNVVPKPEEWGESSKRNTQFLRLSYVQVGRIIFPLGSSQGKIHLMKRLALP